MNEKTLQLIITELGNTIAQLNVDLAVERANVKMLAEELESTREELKTAKADVNTEVTANE